MSDELQELLRRADTSAPAPALDTTDLANQIRRTARDQRRLSACGLALLLLLICSPIFMLRDRRVPDAHPAVMTVSTPEFDATLHERTAALLIQWEKHPKSRVDPTDAFLADLAAQRNQTALLLLHDADHQLRSDNRTAAVTTLRRTIALFPETPAASRATAQLEQLKSRSQS